MSDVIGPKEPKPIRIGGKNGRVLLMDESFNPIRSDTVRSNIPIRQNSAVDSDEQLYMSASTKSSEIDSSRNRKSSSRSGRDQSFSSSSSQQFSSECDEISWSNIFPQNQRTGTRFHPDINESQYNSAGQIVWAGSRSPSLSSSDRERSLTYQHLDAIRATSQNYFDPKDIFTQTPIYYIRPAFTKRVPTPKSYPDTHLDPDFNLGSTTTVSRASTQRSKTNTNDNTNWVLLPATWGSSTASASSSNVLDPVEAKNQSRKAENAGFGHWIQLRGGF